MAKFQGMSDADKLDGQSLSRCAPTFLVYCSVEKLMHQRPNPIHFFFQREMARIEKMELCAGNISFQEFSTLHREDSIVFAPSDERGGCCLRKYSCQSA